VHPTNHPANRKLLRYLCLLMLLFLVQGVFAQGEWNNWYFGLKAGLTFQSGAPVAVFNSEMGTSSYSAVISDSSGQLLFYTNGFAVYNRNHSLLLNGSGLLGEALIRNRMVIAIPFINNPQKYYIFTVNNNPFSGTLGFFYSVVDMSLDNGLGGIVTGMKNLPVPDGSQIRRSITATRHANNRDFWIITTRVENGLNVYCSYLVNETGIHTPVISPSLTTWLSGNDFGPLAPAISYSGLRLITPFYNASGYCFEYSSFIPQTGQVISHFKFNLPEIPGNLGTGCFSLSGNKYYIMNEKDSYSKYKMFQYDASKTDSSDFVNSCRIVYTGNYVGCMQPGNNGKIYFSQETKASASTYIDSLGVINYPELSGASCFCQDNAIGLGGRQSGSAPTFFLQRYFAYINHTGGLCQGMPVTFEPNTWPPPDSLWWNFGDPASGTENFSNDSTPEHIFISTGTFTVQMIVRHVDMRYDTATINITIEPQPSPNLGPDRTVCENQTVVLDAGFNPQWTYLWSTGATTSSIAVSNSGTYGVTVTSPNGCTGSDTVVLSILPGSTPLPKQIRHN